MHHLYVFIIAESARGNKPKVAQRQGSPKNDIIREEHSYDYLAYAGSSALSR
jgi:hypothetical protein